MKNEIFTIETVGNMIMVIDSADQVRKVWGIEDCTERKLNNFKNKQNHYLNGRAVFVDKREVA